MTTTAPNAELERAKRISDMTDDGHHLLSQIYESLVDREFEESEKKIRELMCDLRLMLKSIPDDVF